MTIERKFLKIKLVLSGDVRTVPEEEAKMLVKSKRAVFVRENARESATQKPASEKAVR